MSRLLSIGGLAAGTLALTGLMMQPFVADSQGPEANSQLRVAEQVNAESIAEAGDATLPHAVSPSGAEPIVFRGFAPGANNWNPGHRGADLLLSTDQLVYAATDGRVLYAGRLNDRSLVSIEHDSGLRTTYEPVEPAVKRGDTVVSGDVIGRIQLGHCGDSACLHWGAKWGQDGYIDPLSLLRAGPVRLYE